MAINGFLDNRRELEQAVIGYITMNGAEDKPISNEALVAALNYIGNDVEALKAISSITSKLTKSHMNFHRKYVENGAGRQVLGYYFDWRNKNPNFGAVELKGRRPHNAKKRVPKEPIPVSYPADGPWAQGCPQPVALETVEVDADEDDSEGAEIERNLIQCYETNCGLMVPIDRLKEVIAELQQVDYLLHHA